MRLLSLVAGMVLLQNPWAAPRAFAADRPAEEELFGAPASASPSKQSAAPSSPEPEEAPAPSRLSDQDARGMAPSETQDAFETGEVGPVDPLKVGGQVYLRSFAQFLENVAPSRARFSAPTLVDGYLDARPNSRLRGFVLARMSYDPALDTSSALNQLLGTSVSPLQIAANPGVALDQAWLRFDIDRVVFVTAGQQHVRWGTGKFWNPTDFLTPQRRNPLLPFDPRVGASMVKLHIPYEEKGWNFYALALFNNDGPSSTLGKVGGAARAEVVVNTFELGVDAVIQRGRRPRFGLDLSGALGPLDVYAEAALKTGSEGTRWRVVPLPEGGDSLVRSVEELPSPSGLTPAITGGFSWTFAYADNHTATLGLEYFYNSLGYTDPSLYPWLIYQNAFQPFYVGKHYASVYLLFPAPWDKDHANFTLSNLGNLADLSFVSRLDYSVRVLTHLTLEAFIAGHYGNKTGEFRLQVDIRPGLTINGIAVPSVFLPASVFEMGVGARISI